jgi:choline dehydrogenase
MSDVNLNPKLAGRVGINLDNLSAETVVPNSTNIERPQLHEAALVSSNRTRELNRVLGNDTESVKEYDYVFIGGGATGATAARDLLATFDKSEELKKQGYKVLVLESGVDQPTLQETIPAAHGAASEHPQIQADPNNTGTGTGYWVKHFTELTDGIRDFKANPLGLIWKPRGEGWGGSTRMNANVFVRVDDVDWDKIAMATGDPAFRAASMKPLFAELVKPNYQPVMQFFQALGQGLGLSEKRDERFASIELSTASPKLLFEDKQLAKVALRGLAWATVNLGSPLEKVKRMMSLFDANADAVQKTEGPVMMTMSVTSEGKRNGARGMILGAKELWSDQLTLQDGARAEKLLLDDNKRCTGAVYVDKEGHRHTVKAKKEVIVACGTTETSALLMRSGIAPRDKVDELQALGIEPQVLLDGVGRRQGDRYEVGVVVKLKEPFALLQRLKTTLEKLDKNDPLYQQWESGKGGPLAINGALLSFQMRSRPELAEPDLFVFAVPGKFQGYKPNYSKEAIEDPTLLTFLVLDSNKGRMHGTLDLNKENPLGHPEINHHFHQERTGEGGDGITPSPDSFAIAKGIEKVRELIDSQYKELLATDAQGRPMEIWPGRDIASTEALQLEAEKNTWGHHPRGGAEIGHPNDSLAVTDANFSVLGTTGLRAIDASVLPDNIGTFIVSGLYQIGKLAARKIAADALTGPKPAAKQNLLSIRMNQDPDNLPEAQRSTKKQADEARKQGLISQKQFERLTDGTVSGADVDVAWAAIETAMKQGNELGSDKHTIGHNLLIAVSQQLDKQTPWQTRKESFTDRATRMLDIF